MIFIRTIKPYSIPLTFENKPKAGNTKPSIWLYKFTYAKVSFVSKGRNAMSKEYRNNIPIITFCSCCLGKNLVPIPLYKDIPSKNKQCNNKYMSNTAFFVIF